MNKDDILLFAKSLSKYVVGAEGNISAKYRDGFLIKSSGSSFESLCIEDLVYCGVDCTQLDNFAKKPSMEIEFHSNLLQNKGINYIAHTHPVNVLKIVCTDLINKFAYLRFFPDQVVFNGKSSCIVPYAMPGKKLAKAIESSVSEYITNHKIFPKAILLQNHGLICCGTTIRQCRIATEICEKSAEIFLSSIANNLKVLSQNEIDEIDNNEMENYRKK